MADLLDPLSETSMKLGNPPLERPILDMVHECAQGLPIAKGYYVALGQRKFRVYWVSGASLVVLESGDIHQGPMGFEVPASVTVHSLRSAEADIELAASNPPPGQGWIVSSRRVTLRLDDDSEPLTLPDPLYPLDNENNRVQASAFIDELLLAVSTA